MAVASGTATAVSNRVSRRQADRWAQQGQGAPAYLAETPQGPPQEAPPPPAAAPDPIAQLKELGELHQQGVLTDEEFAAQKAKILG
ncbi:MAG TPA: SHOCT domain-containing protein [Thermoleophilaceae bacterium]